MAWVLDSQAAAYATHNVSAQTWTPFNLTAQAGQIIFVVVETTNITGAVNSPTISLNKPAGETATWKEFGSQAPNAATGSTQRTSLFGIETTMAWAAHPLLVTLGSATVRKIANWQVWDGGTLVVRSMAGVPIAYSVTSPFTITGNSQPRAGDLCQAFVAADRNDGTVPALATDVTNGVWQDAGNAAGGTVGTAGPGPCIELRHQYKLVTAVGNQSFDWVTADGGVAVSFVSAEDWHVIQEGGATSGGLQPTWVFSTPTIPMEVNDLIIGLTMHKPFSTALTTPGTYTLDGSKASGSTPTAGNNTGSEVATAYHKMSDPSDGADITLGTITIGVGRVLRSRGPGGAVFGLQTVFGADTDVTGTTISVTADAALSVRPGDKIFWSLAVKANVAPTAITFAIPGVTGTNYQLTFTGNSTNPDAGLITGYFEVLTGTVTALPTITASYTTGISDAASAFTRARLLLVPEPPISLTVTAQTSDSLTYTWADGGSTGAATTSYDVRLDGGAPVNVGLDLDQTFTGLDHGTGHTLEVRACNPDGCGEWASIVGVTLPGTPVALTTTATETTVEFCWVEAGP